MQVISSGLKRGETMNAEFIKVTSLTKNYKMGEVTVKAIQDITFTIKEGSLWSYLDRLVQVKVPFLT